MKKHVPLLFLFFFFCVGTNAQLLHDIIAKEKEAFRLMTVSGAHSVASPDFDVHFYRCEWNLDPAVRAISGTVTSYFTITSATTSITFDLSQALTVDSVLYHDIKLSFQQSANDGLQLNFPSPLASGQSDSVSVFYGGAPPATGFGSFTQSAHNGTPVLWTLSEPYGAKDWWPCKDALTDKTDSIDILITYPSAYQSSSNGVLFRQQVIGAKKQDYWKHRYPIASYLVAIAVTNYTIDHDSVQLPSGIMPVELYAYPEDTTNFKAATATAKTALQKYSELIGEYPFHKERYAQTQFGWGGGMEHQTNSFITAPNSGLVAHELAHQWFGDAVTCGSWQDLWLNEGFATYMAFVYAQTVVHADPFILLQDWHNSITSSPAGSVFITDTANVNRLFDGRLTYNKGAYVLHMLRWTLGDSLFFRGLRRYLNDPTLRFKNARTADLQRNLEQESGVPLTAFFNDWVYGQGYPSYKGEWNVVNATNVPVVLSQTTSDSSVPFFEMPVPLQLKNAMRDTIIIVNHLQNGETFTLNPGFVPDTIIIDPQLWILSKDNVATKTAIVTSVPSVPEPFGIIVFPNPASDKLTVHLPAAAVKKTSIRLYTISGQEVFAKTVTAGGTKEYAIPVRHLAPGMYWVEVVRDAKKVVKKVLVIK